MNSNFIEEELKNKHFIDSDEYLNKYINHIFDIINDLYYIENLDKTTVIEKHHILPVSNFPEYKNEKWNIVKLSYHDHSIVHLFLYKAINIRSYQRPLNWMFNKYKNKEELSRAAKRGWIKLKNNSFKFNKFKESRSAHMKSLTSCEQSRRSSLGWKNKTTKKYNEFCLKMKSLWTEEYTKNHSEKMKKYYSIDENRIKKSEQAKYHWDNMTKENREKFNDKMSIVNKNLEKREKAGKSIKKLWEDPIFLDKMKNRKTRSGTDIKITFIDNTTEILNMSQIKRKYNLSYKQLIKILDKNIKVDKLLADKSSILLYECLFNKNI